MHPLKKSEISQRITLESKMQRLEPLNLDIAALLLLFKTYKKDIRHEVHGSCLYEKQRFTLNVGRIQCATSTQMRIYWKGYGERYRSSEQEIDWSYKHRCGNAYRYHTERYYGGEPLNALNAFTNLTNVFNKISQYYNQTHKQAK